MKASLKQAKEMLESNKDLSTEFKALFAMILSMMELLLTLAKLPKNSQNSSIPPSADPNRPKVSKSESDKKRGGQKGRKFSTLEPVSDPDQIISVPIDRSTLPPGHTYTEAGFSSRQVVEIDLLKMIIEYRYEILQDENGKRYTAPCPEGFSRPIQYGNSVKTGSVYMSLFQMIPYNRIEDYFVHKAGIPISAGSLYNFNEEAFNRLEKFERIAKQKLISSPLIHADETGINVGGKRIWLHTASGPLWTLFQPHAKRGTEAMEHMNILPHFKGILVHDHWSSYFTYKNASHSLCNAHHLRELQAMIEAHPSNSWAKDMKKFLEDLNTKTRDNKGVLDPKPQTLWREHYRKILAKGDLECPLPPPPPPDSPKKRGKPAKTKERNLLERLRDFEDETLRFMTLDYVPFTNNQGENDIRMTKVQQKISGCFRSFKGAEIFCRVRSYLLTCQKHQLCPTDALNILFSGKLPAFCDD